jgi:hypothetical protein
MSTLSLACPTVFVASPWFLIEASDYLADSAEKMGVSFGIHLGGRFFNTSFEGSLLNLGSLGDPFWPKIFLGRPC